MAVFLPLLTKDDPNLFSALDRVGPIVVDARNSVPLPQPPRHAYLLVDPLSGIDVQAAVTWLDEGMEKVIVPISWATELIGTIPPERIVLLLDVGNASAVPDKLRSGVSGVLLKTPTVDFDLISSISKFFQGSDIYILCSEAGFYPSPPNIRQFKSIGATFVILDTHLTLEQTSATQLNVADIFLAPITSDRPDGLYPTIVSSHTGHTLGLVYSSDSSVKESIVTGKGVYHSRKHGLWRKGETSGATQDVIRIRLDCDSDSLEYRVVQHGVGFCHLNQKSCFSSASGLPALESVLKARLESAPSGSYTKRLFEDPDLLKSKIMEEAEELCQAKTPEEVAFEAADLLYFTMTRCITSGVGIIDIEHALDKKAKRITRRAGNAKPQREYQKSNAAVPPPLGSAEKTAGGFIRMRTADLCQLSVEDRTSLLRRPVLKSEEMISKVKPIVDAVRHRGDDALLEFTAKFDKARLSSNVVLRPFAPDSMQIDEEVRKSIDVAYSNILKFHEAHKNDKILTVETMPGVVCSRFARPIARVGLYVPGGTAILPSTALMLGIPAQVAGCKEIILATPPRHDGSISPEVMYVAHLVGASAIVKAGGAQAIAALAYGTKTVPKVDKIFGPGNQWVTAAKMLVQNDTDALVSIDMPAGPSEVLVIIDHTADPAFVAADLLSQAEHGVDSQVVLIAVDITAPKLAEIEKEIDQQANVLPRVDIIRVSISKSLIVKVRTVDEAIAFSNDYAPEHLILHLEDAGRKVPSIENAGSIFVGAYTPESCGDYASGTNHTLPTNGYAKQFSGVNTLSFQKHITSQEITADGLGILGPVVATLADCEGLQAHAHAVRIRLRRALEAANSSS